MHFVVVYFSYLHVLPVRLIARLCSKQSFRDSGSLQLVTLPFVRPDEDPLCLADIKENRREDCYEPGLTVVYITSAHSLLGKTYQMAAPNSKGGWEIQFGWVPRRKRVR